MKLFIDVVPRLLPPLLAAGPVVLLGDAAQAPGPAVLLLHEAGVQVGLGVRPADWLQRGRADPATAAPLEDGETAGEGNLSMRLVLHFIYVIVIYHTSYRCVLCTVQCSTQRKLQFQDVEFHC